MLILKPLKNRFQLYSRIGKEKLLPLINSMPQKNSSALDIYFIEMNNARQSEVSVIFTNEINKKHPDYFSMLLINSILGGGSQGRLFQNLREDKAFTYGSYSRFQSNKYSRAKLSAFASVRSSVTDSAVVELVRELEKIRTEKVTLKELNDAKAKYLGTYVLAIEKPETIARYAHEYSIRKPTC